MKENITSLESPEISAAKETPRNKAAEPAAQVALLTGGGDRPYAFGLGTQLISKGVTLDLIGSDDLDCPEFRNQPNVNFLNLRGDQRPESPFREKITRVLVYYIRLIRYAFTSKPKVFHLLWNNKFEYFDRTLLMLYYKLLGKATVLTVHNVNIRRRDSRDSALNRVTLWLQYRLCDHIFVHSEKMKADLLAESGVPFERVTVIPFGINNAVPHTQLTRNEARQKLGIASHEKTILFFGNIAPYKGLEYLVAALQDLWRKQSPYRLVVAGRPKGSEQYWIHLKESMEQDCKEGRVIVREEYIPDEDTEIYFKAADVLALPYRYIYQSGVLFLGYSFGLPVLAADVGPLKEEIIEGETGFAFKPEDHADLARAIETYFSSDLYSQLESRKQGIIDFATGKHSWDIVGDATVSVYRRLQQEKPSGKLSDS